MKPTDLTIKLLEEIRDSVRELGSSLGGRIDETNIRIDKTNVRIDGLATSLGQRLERLESRVVEGEIRMGTALTDLTGAVLQLGTTLGRVRRLLRDNLGLRPRVERCEADIDQLKGHTGLK